MRLTKLPLQNSLRVNEYLLDKRTSEILDNGPFFNFRNPGLAYHTPLGQRVVSAVEKLSDEEHMAEGILKFKIPGYMKRNVLEGGEKINQTFANKFVMLPAPMEEYMILTTHEMEMLDWLKEDIISYRSLPIRLSFRRDFLRPIKDPQGILKLREFGVHAALSLDKNRQGFEESLGIYSRICERIFNRLGIPFIKKESKDKLRTNSHLDFDLEYFYGCSEGDNLPIGENGEKLKALSLSMGYLFNPKSCSLHVRDRNNQLIIPSVGTYAMGIERIVYSAFDSSRDNKGFNLPEIIRPYETSLLMFDDYEDTISKSEGLYSVFGQEIIFDDRRGISRKEKSFFSDLIGCQNKVIISKSGIRLRYRNQEADFPFGSTNEAANFIANSISHPVH